MGRSAKEDLLKAPFPFRRQIVQAIHKLKNNPRPSDCETISPDILRLPVHGWRIVYEIDDEALTVVIYRIAL